MLNSAVKVMNISLNQEKAAENMEEIGKFCFK